MNINKKTNDMKETTTTNFVFEGKGEGKKEANKKFKVFPKIGGLTNIGRTFFTNGAEIDEKNQEAQWQMAQKYGSEIYGASAQMSGQSSTGTTSGTGTGSAAKDVGGGGGLVSCTVKPFLTVPAKESVIRESSGADNFIGSLEKLLELVQSKDDGWRESHKEDIDNIGKMKTMVQNNGLSQDAKKFYVDIQGILEKWCKEDEDFKKASKVVSDSWAAWSKKPDKSNGRMGDLGNTAKNGSDAGSQDWNPNLTFKIDIVTHFDASWYKRKFKSGLLNAAINLVKSDAASRGQAGSMKGHKYTQDEMLDGDNRKLDGIQWKMTNKIAKDYINFLLGWSRPKERYADPSVPVPNELSRDEGLGKSFAKKALSGRGILGRLKQKIFAGGQNNNTISVVFQLADYNDGWTVVEQKSDDEKIKNTDKGEKKPDSGSGEEEAPKQTNESSVDPFFEEFGRSSYTSPLTRHFEDGEVLESDRYKLVKQVCEGVDGSVEELVDNCLIGYTYK